MIKSIGIEEQVRLWDGCQSYWKLDSTGGTTAYDSIAGINGVCTNISWDSSGKNGYCALFDAAGDNINIGKAYNFERTDSFSFSTWVKRVTTNTTTFLFSKSLASGNYTGYAAYFKGGGSDKLSISLVGTSSSNKLEFDSTTVFNSTTDWYHIVITYDGTSTLAGFKLYVNGVEESQTATTQALSTSIRITTDFQIGNRNSAASILGYLNEFAIWNRCLNAVEAKALYSNGNGKFYGTPVIYPKPVLWYYGEDVKNHGTLGTNYKLKRYSPTDTYDDNTSGFFSGNCFSFSASTAYGLGGGKSFWLPSGIQYKSSAISMCCWVKNSDASFAAFGSALWIGFWQNAASGEYTRNVLGFRHQPLNTGDKQWYVQFYNGSANDTIYAGASTANNTNWHHLAVTLTASAMRFYFDGSYINQDTSLQTPSTSTTTYYRVEMQIGTTYTKPTYGSGAISYPMKGWVDDCRLYLNTLTDAQVLAIYNAGRKN